MSTLNLTFKIPVVEVEQVALVLLRKVVEVVEVPESWLRCSLC